MEEERKVSVITEEKTGKVNIADEVVAIIADLAISDVEGVLFPTGRKKHAYGKGITVRIENGSVFCDISVILKSGYKVMPVAQAIQQKMKASIENMLDLDVREVNVSIIGIEKDRRESKESKEVQE